MRSRSAGSAAMSTRLATDRAAWRNAGCAVTSLTRSPSTKTRRPSLSERRYSVPLRIRPTPLGLGPTIEQLRRGRHSVDVGVVAVVFLQVGEKCDRLIDAARAVGRNHVDHGSLDILAHGDGAADIDMGAVGKPGPEIPADLAQ